MEPNEAKKIIEALLFTSEKPITIEQIKEVLEDIETKDIRNAVLELKAEYETLGRSFKIFEVAGGFQMVTEPAFAEYLKKFYRAKSKDKLTKQALETLAIIAYRQPITKAEIEDIRGVNVDGVVETLGDRLMIRVVGRKDAPGRPILYGTSKEFLERFGLSSLNELPKLSEFTEADIDVQEVQDGLDKLEKEDRPAGQEDSKTFEQQGRAEPQDRPAEGEGK